MVQAVVTSLSKLPRFSSNFQGTNIEPNMLQPLMSIMVKLQSSKSTQEKAMAELWSQIHNNTRKASEH